MREVKFKAFHKKCGVCRVLSIDFVNSEVCLLIDEDRANQAMFKFSEIEFIRYTGLKDKIGKESYEGDILEFKTNNMFNRTVMEWSDTYNSYSCAMTVGDCEIIGNIYEHPELMEAK